MGAGTGAGTEAGTGGKRHGGAKSEQGRPLVRMFYVQPSSGRRPRTDSRNPVLPFLHRFLHERKTGELVHPYIHSIPSKAHKNHCYSPQATAQQRLRSRLGRPVMQSGSRWMVHGGFNTSQLRLLEKMVVPQQKSAPPGGVLQPGSPQEPHVVGQYPATIPKGPGNPVRHSGSLP
jgi:hypothetical protein